jgi:excinuclease ABC subunit B
MVIMYAERVTDSMRRAIDETDRRRGVQRVYNLEHDITPQTIQKAIAESLISDADYVDVSAVAEAAEDYGRLADIPKQVAGLEREMRAAAAELEFERAAELRDRIQRLRERELQLREA